MRELRKITSSEYAELMFPAPGLIVVQKEKMGDKMGKIWLPQQAISRSSKYCGVGIITKMFLGTPESDHEDYLRQIYREGDFVSFNPTTPFMAPSPLNWVFENPDKKEDASFIIHICDLLGPIFETKDQAEEFRKRVKESKHGRSINNL